MLNRNAESHFAKVPTLNAPRSVFDRSHEHISTANIGQVVPIYVDEIYPGDTVKMKTSLVARLQTLLTPIFGNVYVDIYWYFDRMVNLWSHFKEFMGENTGSAWVSPIQYTVPTISAPSGGFAVGTIADHMGWPVGVNWSATDEQAPTAIWFRSYARIMNEFFRDQNLSDPLNIPFGDSNQTGSNGTNYINDCANGGMPFVACKYHDYFTSAMKSPQKAAQPVTIGLITQNRLAPVITGSSGIYPTDGSYTGTINPTEFVTTGAGLIGSDRGLGVKATSGKLQTGSTSSALTGTDIVPNNLYADIANSIGAVTINELRLAFQLQRYYEHLAASGSRYTEQIREFFGVSCPDGLIGRPEYLGGCRIPLNIQSVTNTAQSQNDFLGDLGAKSETANIHGDFVHSFDTHGVLMGLLVVRYDHCYSQGLDKKFKRKNLLDWYNPTFQTLGAMPIFTDEIYADATNMATADVFAYQEAWSELRYAKNEITGEMRPGIPNTLASWHLGDYYTQAPTFSDAWIREDKTNVDRVLAVTSSVSNQVLYDIWFDAIYTRRLPIYSVPGLIDHH